VTLALFAVGFTAVIGQVLLMRELVATFYGNELLLALILGAWLAWGAAGSGLAARRWQARRRTVALGLALAGVILPAQLALVRDLRSVLGIPQGAFVEFIPMVAATALIPAPLCGTLGALFSLAARTLRGADAGARAYLWETGGAVAGGALFSFVLIRWLNPLQSALLVASLDLCVAAATLILATPIALSPRLLALPLFALLIPLSLPLGQALDTATLSRQWPDLALAVDSPYGRLTVVARAGQRAFFENGLLSFETQSTFPEEVVHFPLLAHPMPRSVLLVGGGVGGDLREMLRHPVEELVYVELDPAVIEAARGQLPTEEVALLDDPRVRLVLTDGRRYVQMAERTFDVVVLDLPAPSTGSLNRFYTREFFVQVRGILSSGGVLSLGLPSAENYWSPEMARRNGSVYWTLREVFPHVLVLPGDHNFFLASDAPLPDDFTTLTTRMEERGLDPRWVTPAYVEYVFTTDRLPQVRAELERSSDVRRNRDRHPICYYYDLALWLSRFYPGLRPIFERTALANLAWAVLPLAGLVVVGRRRRRLAIPLAVAAVGLAEMTLQGVILFAFQVDHGTLYGRVSLVVTALMAGLALGALLGRRLAGRARRALLGVLGGVVALGGVLAVLPSGVPEAVYLVLALAAGGLAGLVFPLAVTLVGADEGRAAGSLYAADLAGGCLGALLTAAFLVPLLGLDQTALTAALVGIAALLVVI
jgi:spermidine synthase